MIMVFTSFVPTAWPDQRTCAKSREYHVRITASWGRRQFRVHFMSSQGLSHTKDRAEGMEKLANTQQIISNKEYIRY